MKASELNLRELLEFCPDDGILRVGNQRNLIFSQDAFAKLRRLMHDQLGQELARSMLTKFGYQNGAGDFRTLSQLFEFTDENERLGAGPLMHSWSGIVKVEPTLMEMNRSTGHFHFKGIWRNSYEAEIHLSEFGLSPFPVCYTLTGYGSGWCSEFFGMPLLEIETKCVACGDPVCEWEIRPFRTWGAEADPWKNAMMGDQTSISRQLEDRRREVERLNLDLETQVKERTAQNERLIRVLCHDLKAPLAVLKHALSDLATKDSANNIHSETANEASRAIEEIIRHVQMTPEGASSKGETLNVQNVDFGESMNRTLKLFGLKILEKELTIEVKDELEVGSRLLVDPSIFSNNILNNLISNALKFSPRGGRIICRASSENGSTKIEISDQGIGMPREAVARFNNRGQVISKLGLNGEKGTGLGLNLVRDFVEMHGGTMELQSRTVVDYEIGHGTTVGMRFPGFGQ